MHKSKVMALARRLNTCARKAQPVRYRSNMIWQVSEHPGCVLDCCDYRASENLCCFFLFPRSIAGSFLGKHWFLVLEGAARRLRDAAQRQGGSSSAQGAA